MVSARLIIKHVSIFFLLSFLSGVGERKIDYKLNKGRRVGFAWITDDNKM